MKITKILTFAVLLIAGTIFTSCSWNDSNDNGGSNLALVTINVNTDKTVWGLTDDSKKIYFNPNSTIVSQYKAVQGQRAIVYFNTLSEAVSGYDYNAQVTAIQDVLTKNVVKVTTAAEDTLGNDGIKIINAWIAGGYLNMQVQMYYSGTVTHYLNLADNQYNQTADEKKSGYVSLEFRHKAGTDAKLGGTLVTGYVCFKLSTYAPDIQGEDGIYLRYTSLDKATDEFDYMTISNSTKSVIKGGAFSSAPWNSVK